MKISARGFTMIETVVAIGVFSIFFAAIALIIQQVLVNVGTSRVRSVALSLGQEKMELIRNLPYANVGTVGGIPSGPIAQNENVTINSQVFTVTTSIFYVDDPFDGSAPTDSIPADYKRVRVQVNWGGLYPSRVPVTLVTNIVPKGLETNPGGGVIYLQVVNAQGVGIGNANVAIVNNQVTPTINLNTLTNSNGSITIPAAPACITCYQITVTKNGYSTDRTYTNQEVANPLQPKLTVLEGKTSQATFSIDQLSNMLIHTVGPQANGYPVQPNVIFTLRGNKIIGYDTQDNPVYKYSFSTNSGGGNVGIPALEWDNYTIDLSNSNFTLAGSTPLMPITVNPGSANDVTVVTESKYNASLLVTMKNTKGELQASVAATLSNPGFGINITKVTTGTGSANFGQVFYNNLTPGIYDLIATLSGYPEATSSVSIIQNQNTTLVFQ